MLSADFAFLFSAVEVYCRPSKSSPHTVITIDCKKPIIDYDVRNIATGEELEMAEGTYVGDILLEFAPVAILRTS